MCYGGRDPQRQRCHNMALFTVSISFKIEGEDIEPLSQGEPSTAAGLASPSGMWVEWFLSLPILFS